MKFNLVRITAKIAEDEPAEERLFGTAYDARQTQLRLLAQRAMQKGFDPWDRLTEKHKEKQERA